MTTPTLSVINQHIAAARSAGTLATVEHIADELAALLNADPERVRKVLHHDRDEANYLARHRREVDFEERMGYLDERTTEALDALSRPVDEVEG